MKWGLISVGAFINDIQLLLHERKNYLGGSIMQYRNFGQCGFQVSALGFGTMRFPTDDKVNERVGDRFSNNSRA